MDNTHDLPTPKDSVNTPEKKVSTDIRVAKLLDQRKFVLNQGRNVGISVGQRFIVYELGEDIVDPVTGEDLGALELSKGRGVIIHSQERMSVLELDKIKTSSKPLSEIMSSLSGLEEQAESAEINVGDYAKAEG